MSTIDRETFSGLIREYSPNMYRLAVAILQNSYDAEDAVSEAVLKAYLNLNWGYNGTFSYNLGEESANNIHPAYEAPCSFEGVCCCVLKDGRIVLVPMADPGKTYFYYQSSLKD